MLLMFHVNVSSALYFQDTFGPGGNSLRFSIPTLKLSNSSEPSTSRESKGGKSYPFGSMELV